MNIKAKAVKPIMESLIALEKQHGAELTRYAMRKRLTFEGGGSASQRNQTNRERTRGVARKER